MGGEEARVEADREEKNNNDSDNKNEDGDVRGQGRRRGDTDEDTVEEGDSAAHVLAQTLAHPPGQLVMRVTVMMT